MFCLCLTGRTYLGQVKKSEKKYRYRLAGPSCLAGDVIGDYSFDKPLKRGDKLIFTDMALYSIVKEYDLQRNKSPGHRGDKGWRKDRGGKEVRL